MTFLSPTRLLLIAPVLALVAGYWWSQHRRARYAVRFTNIDLLDSVAPRRPGWRRHVTAGLAGIAAATLVVGLAQPAVAMRVPTEDAVVMLAIDTSTSMTATDVDPSRIEAAIDEAVTFVDQLPDGIEVGLVAFNETAQVLASPTTDHGEVIAAIEDLTTDRGTAGGDAIEAALAAISATLDASGVQTVAATDDEATSDSDAPAATIVVLSDGATTTGADILAAAQEAATQNVPVSTITYGTAAGTVTVNGQAVSVPPDAATMAEVADLTGGTAFEAASADELRAAYENIEGRIGSTVEERDLSLVFVAVAFVVLLLSAAAAFVWTGRFI